MDHHRKLFKTYPDMLSGSCRHELCNVVADVLLVSLNIHLLSQGFFLLN